MTDYAQFWTADTPESGEWLTDPGHEGEAYWQFGVDRAAELQVEFPEAAGVVVDYGCGLGRVIRSVGAAERIGIDVSPEHLALAEQLSPGPRYLLTDGRSIPLPDESVDLVYSYQVLQHLDATDVPPVLADTYRVLKPGGRCYHTFSLFGESYASDKVLDRGPLKWTGTRDTSQTKSMVAIAYTSAIVDRLARDAGFSDFEVRILHGVKSYDYVALVGRK